MTTLQLDTPAVSRRFWSGMTLLVCALLVAPMVASQLGGNYWVRVIDFALLYVMLALGLNIVVGYTGLLDMGFIAFYAVGAYLAALLASPHLLDVFPILNSWFPDGLHTSWLVIIPLAALVAAGCGIVLGGMGHIPGVILGAVLLTALPELLRSQAAPVQQALFGEVLIDPEVLRQLFYGLALVLVMLLRPQGIWPARHQGAKA